MDYKETVLYNTDTLFTDNDLDYDEGGGFTAESVVDALVRQAGITWEKATEFLDLTSETQYKAGIKEVVEWVNKRSNEDFYISIPQDDWQSMLKEWGIG